MNIHAYRIQSPRSIVTRLPVVAALILVCPIAFAGVCDRVIEASSATGAAAAALTAQISMSAAPVAAVSHSSGSLILTGASGYLAKTLGMFATAWAVATAPVTLAVTGGAVVVGAGVLAACYLSDDTPNLAAVQHSQDVD